MRHIQDAYLKDELLLRRGPDRNSYVPTHNTISKIGYGDNASAQADFNDPGTGRGQNQEQYIFKEYRRDSGELIWDVLAIY